VANEAAARQLWEEILSLATTLGDERWKERATAELGEIRYLNGEFTAAERMVKHAVFWQFVHDPGAAIYYTSLVGNGLVESGQPQNGLHYCNVAIMRAAVARNAGFPFLAYQGKARALLALHRNAEGDAVLQVALKRARAEGNRAAEAQLLIVAGIGAENPRKAIEYFRAANDLTRTAGFHHAFAWSSFELAKAYRNEGNIAAAETYAYRGLEAMQGLEDKYHLPQHVALLADLKASRGEFTEADRLYEEAADMIDGLLVTAPSRQLESSLIATLSGAYLGRFDVAATKLRDTSKAYEAIEEARGRSLADALQGQRTPELSTDPLTVSAQQDINRIQGELLHEADREKRQDLLDKLFAAEQAFTPIHAGASPLQVAIARSRPADLPALQSRLRTDEAVLEYVLDDPRSFCLGITRTDSRVFVLPEGRQRIEHDIDEYLTGIRARTPATEVSQRLYAELLQPVLGGTNRPKLLVVPDGKLNFLPYDALVDPEGRLLLRSHAVSFCPSGTVLYLLRSASRTVPSDPHFLGVGDVRFAAGRAPATAGARSAGLFADLPNTRDELIAASRAVGGQVTLLMGSEATEAAVKSQPLATFDVIHIATHGIPNVEFPDRAALLLAPDAQGREDGLLQAREIRNLPLRADLVALSACDSGVGNVEGEEGVANLVRAFLFAGAKSVLASMWSAGDTSSTYLTTQFYRHLAQGDDPSVALQRAKLDAIEQFGSNAVPFYWAGFQIFGDGSGSVLGPKRPAQKRASRRSAAGSH
jgi:CHAT domain-containing protein